MKRKLINSFIILSASSAISKIFSILNRMLLSRLLPLEAMSLYLVIMPTLSLCLTLGQVGIPSAVFRLILHPKYKNYKVIITAIILSFFSVIVICGTLFILSPFIAHSLLKNDYTLYPILSFLIFIPLIAISGIIKNYYLAKGHVLALNKLEKENKGLFIYNLGTGTGYSVLDMVKAFEKATGKEVPYKIAPRRSGDIATCYANPKKAKEELGWEATKTLEDMCRDSWNYINS